MLQVFEEKNNDKFVYYVANETIDKNKDRKIYFLSGNFNTRKEAEDRLKLIKRIIKKKQNKILQDKLTKKEIVKKDKKKAELF